MMALSLSFERSHTYTTCVPVMERSDHPNRAAMQAGSLVNLADSWWHYVHHQGTGDHALQGMNGQTWRTLDEAKRALQSRYDTF